MLSSCFLFAQTEETVTEPNTEQITTEEEDFIYKMNQKGDHLIKISLMVNLPFKPTMSQLHVGGAGSLGYMRFINSNIALGGDVSFSYATTVGNNIFTFVPIIFKAMYQFTLQKFEFPILLGIGGSFENYNDFTYFGLIIKPEVGVYYRYSPAWSFGATTGLNIMPQWSQQSETNYTGFIMDFALTARYHF